MEKEIIQFYEHYAENERLNQFPLEAMRTRELILRHLGPPPQKILDVGGGAGAYSFWLQEPGHHVVPVDASPRHVRQAGDYAAQTGRSLADIQLGDARSLDDPSGLYDMVLLLGPLYHLTTRDDRLKALRRKELFYDRLFSFAG